ncbi:hypothetical protein VNO78_01105 [Psophocarpus tetragonolobus]|uniref:Uncharacterized protein n=1 Tax=Psophocarpus tetragonolobus TaxID=3891 RepID=A0AAN9XV13_PSOTE
MGSRGVAFTALFLSINLLFFSMVTSQPVLPLPPNPNNSEICSIAKATPVSCFGQSRILAQALLVFILEQILKPSTVMLPVPVPVPGTVPVPLPPSQAISQYLDILFNVTCGINTTGLA